jgi:hypothetical protein
MQIATMQAQLTSALSDLDRFLKEFSGQTLLSKDEVFDFILDLRLTLQNV